MWQPLIDVLTRRAALETDEREATRLRLEVGSIWDLRLYDAGASITAYQAVLDADPQSLPALRALEQLYEKTGQSEKYLEVLEAQLDVSPSDAERVSLYERMAAAWEERFGKLDRAAEAYEKIVALDNRNFGAYRELARLYQQAGRADALVETYRNHIMATSDVATRIDLYVAMGAAYEGSLQDVDRAVEAYTDVLSFDGEEPRALDALGRLYERMSEWDRAVDVTAQLVRITDDPKKQVELYARMGRIQYGRLQDVESAEANFLRGLAVDNSHVPTMEALVKLYSDRGDWLKAAQMMVRAESYTPVVIDKVRLLNEAAHIYQHRLRQPEAAKQLYAAVIANDPEHVDAGKPLAELYFQAKEYAQLSPVIDMLVRKVAQSHPDPRELNELYFRAAKTADELGENDKALSYYKSAYDLDPTYQPTLMGRADLLYKLGDWDASGKIYQTLLVQNRDGAAESDAVRIYYRLGMVRQHLNERKKALNMFEKALELDPPTATRSGGHRAAAGVGDWEAVVGAKRGLLTTSPDKERIQLLQEIAAVYKDKLANPQKSIGALQRGGRDRARGPGAAAEGPRPVRGDQAVEEGRRDIERFIQLTTDPVRRGAYCHAAGTICRDELKALDEAVGLLHPRARQLLR
jgi:tetratricopeptide (TPR) repeat protein